MNKQLGLAAQLGQAQANNKPSGLSGAAGGALSGAAAGSAFGPWGTGIGALGGGLAGYFSTKG